MVSIRNCNFFRNCMWNLDRIFRFLVIPCGNISLAEIPQCIRQISHNAPFCNRNVHMCEHFCYSGALWDICLMHCVQLTINHHWFRLLASHWAGDIHNLNHRWPRLMMPFGIAMPQWYIQAHTSIEVISHIFYILMLSIIPVCFSVVDISIKQLGHLFQNTFLTSYVNHPKSETFVSNWSIAISI